MEFILTGASFITLDDKNSVWLINVQYEKALLLIALIVPFSIEFAIIALSNVVPDLLANGAVPAPTALGILWSGLLVYVLVGIPFLTLVYIRNLQRRIVTLFVIGEVVIYLIFSPVVGLAPAGFPIVVWWHIPIALMIGSAIYLRETNKPQPLAGKTASATANYAND